MLFINGSFDEGEALFVSAHTRQALLRDDYSLMRIGAGVVSLGSTRWARSTAHAIYPSVPGRAHCTLRFSSSKKFSRKFTWTLVDPPLADSGAGKTTKRLPSGAKSRGG